MMAVVKVKSVVFYYELDELLRANDNVGNRNREIIVSIAKRYA